ncbi:MAG TPA: HAD hydrolase family protein [Phycisphaerae bacterium]|nr:HAD hydrolase family protein [Phycisphaerae bacterium]HNU45664.1 HAD hydrolase family protein [Phycisphaerae bacterium]
MQFDQIKLLLLDVDGVLTDGRLCYTADGESSKVFHVQDGCGIKLWQAAGGLVGLLSGREGSMLSLRARDLGIALVRAGQRDKLAGYLAVLAECHVVDAEVAYVGDDLPDLGPLRRCALPVAVANAVPAVKRAAAYVTRRCGGEGAVAEVVEYVLRKQQRWASACRRVSAEDGGDAPGGRGA